MTRVLLTGAGGLLGGVVCRTAPSGVEVIGGIRRTPAPEGIPTAAIDLGSLRATAAIVRLAPDVVIHCAYDKHEEDIVGATAAVAGACHETGAALIAMSTDVVFDGEHAPYAEDDAPDPVTDYGRWKAEAERIVAAACPDAAIVRTSLIIHSDPPDHGAQWLRRSLGEGKRVSLFTDEVRCPVMAVDLAAALWELASLPGERRGGIWHVAGPEPMSRAELGALMIDHWGLDGSLVDLRSQSTEPGPRPRDLTVTCERMLSTLTVRPRPVDAAALANPW